MHHREHFGRAFKKGNLLKLENSLEDSRTLRQRG